MNKIANFRLIEKVAFRPDLFKYKSVKALSRDFQAASTASNILGKGKKFVASPNPNKKRNRLITGGVGIASGVPVGVVALKHYRNFKNPKTAESAYDPDVRKELKATSDIARTAPAKGLFGGALLGNLLGAGLYLKRRPQRALGAALTVGLPGAAGILGGTAIGAQVQKTKRDKFVSAMPKGNKFRRIYFKNRGFGGDIRSKNETKAFNEAYNRFAVTGEPLSAKHKVMAENLFGSLPAKTTSKVNKRYRRKELKKRPEKYLPHLSAQA